MDLVNMDEDTLTDDEIEWISGRQQGTTCDPRKAIRKLAQR